MVSLVTGIIGVSIAVLIIVLIRKDRLHAHHGLGWILVALSFALLGLFPGIIDRLAQIIGIGYPPVRHACERDASDLLIADHPHIPGSEVEVRVPYFAPIRDITMLSVLFPATRNSFRTADDGLALPP